MSLVPLSARSRDHNDKDPVFTPDRQGGLWVAWQSYWDKLDRILARHLVKDEVGPLVEISEAPGINSKPAIACAADGTVWIAWSAQREHGWAILARAIRGNQLGPVIPLRQGIRLAYVPALAADGQGHVWAAWHEVADGRHRVVGSLWSGGSWSSPGPLDDRGSGDSAGAYRPVLCADPHDTTGNGAWLAYEVYQDRGYSIWLHRWTPDGLGEAIRVNLTKAWELFPRCCPDDDHGLWITWVATHDVQDRRGIVDHKVEIMAAHWTDGELRPYASPDPNAPPGYVTHLYDGLLGREAYWGFLGRRRRPQLVRQANGTVWILYERKEDELRNRHGPDALFYSTPLTGPDQGNIFEINDDAYAYTVNGDWIVNGNQLPYVGQSPDPARYGDVCAGYLELEADEPVSIRPASDWDFWQPVSLPLSERPTSRPQITVDGQTYTLYWGDTHCHGNFSADAEGEIDENYYWGRDKANLDFMAITDNDFIYDDLLSTSAWAVLRAEAGIHNKPSDFVTLSGYERSFREPEAGPPDEDAGLTSYREKTVSNHRIVLFPDDQGLLLRSVEPDADTLEKFVAEIEKTNAFVYPHHADWRIIPNARLGGAEACSSWDVYMHLSDAIPQAWRAGYRLALIGSSDTHRVVPGHGGSLMGVWATELSRKAIMEALWSRRCFATNGERMWFDVRINDAFMGEADVPSSSPVEVQCQVTAPRPVIALRLFRDGEQVDEAATNGKEVSYTFYDQGAPAGERFYYVEAELAPRPRTPMKERGGNLQVARGDFGWSSPIWVQVQ